MSFYRTIKIDIVNFKTAFQRYSGFSLEELLKSVYFNLDEIAEIETASGKNVGPIDAKERRHDGLLKAERDNIDKAIQASVRAALYCEKHSPVLKKDFLDFIDKNHKGLPRTIVDKIWQKIPRSHKKGPGAPQKTAKK